MARKGNKPKASERERRFVELFMGRAMGNGTQAVILAKWTKNRKSARSIAARMLASVSVQRAVAARAASSSDVATRQELQQFFSDVALGRLKFTKADLGHRLRAGELLGKSHRMFIDRVDIHNFDHAAYLAGSEEPDDSKNEG